MMMSNGRGLTKITMDGIDSDALHDAVYTAMTATSDRATHRFRLAHIALRCEFVSRHLR